MPLPVQNPRVSAQIHETYNVVGRYRAQVDEVIVPVVMVDDLTTGGGFFPEVRRATASATQAAVVGERFVARLETPPGVLAVIDRADVDSTANIGIQIFFGSSFPAPATIAAKAFIDGRLRNRGEQPAAVLSFNTQVAGLAVVHQEWTAIATNGLRQWGLGWPIGQVGAFDFVEFLVTAANLQVILSLQWDEYLIRP